MSRGLRPRGKYRPAAFPLQLIAHPHLTPWANER
jgi:hypothetical protein